MPMNDFMGASLVTLKIFELWVNNLCLGIADLYRFLPTPTIQWFRVKQESLYRLGFLIFIVAGRVKSYRLYFQLKILNFQPREEKYLLEVL